MNQIVLIGLLKSKEDNMDAIDMKRPYLTFETVIQQNDHHILFEDVPVLFAKNELARSVNGLKEGRLYLIFGHICSSSDKEAYIECTSIDPVFFQDTEVSRIQMISYVSKNFGILDGYVSEIAEDHVMITRKRETLVRGSFKEIDEIRINTKECSAYREGMHVLFSGILTTNGFYPNSYLRIEE